MSRCPMHTSGPAPPRRSRTGPRAEPAAVRVAREQGVPARPAAVSQVPDAGSQPAVCQQLGALPASASAVRQGSLMSGKRARASFAVSLWVSPGGAVSASPHSSARSCRQSPVPPACSHAPQRRPGLRPPEELLQGPELVAGVRVAVAGQQVDQPPLHVVAAGRGPSWRSWCAGSGGRRRTIALLRCRSAPSWRLCPRRPGAAGTSRSPGANGPASSGLRRRGRDCGTSAKKPRPGRVANAGRSSAAQPLFAVQGTYASERGDGLRTGMSDMGAVSDTCP